MYNIFDVIDSLSGATPEALNDNPKLPILPNKCNVAEEFVSKISTLEEMETESDFPYDDKDSRWINDTR